MHCCAFMVFAVNCFWKYVFYVDVKSQAVTANTNILNVATLNETVIENTREKNQTILKNILSTVDENNSKIYDENVEKPFQNLVRINYSREKNQTVLNNTLSTTVVEHNVKIDDENEKDEKPSQNFVRNKRLAQEPKKISNTRVQRVRRRQRESEEARRQGKELLKMIGSSMRITLFNISEDLAIKKRDGDDLQDIAQFKEKLERTLNNTQARLEKLTSLIKKLPSAIAETKAETPAPQTASKQPGKLRVDIQTTEETNNPTEPEQTNNPTEPEQATKKLLRQDYADDNENSPQTDYDEVQTEPAYADEAQTEPAYADETQTDQAYQEEWADYEDYGPDANQQSYIPEWKTREHWQNPETWGYPDYGPLRRPPSWRPNWNGPVDYNGPPPGYRGKGRGFRPNGRPGRPRRPNYGRNNGGWPPPANKRRVNKYSV